MSNLNAIAEGLDSDQVKKRTTRYGYNLLKEEPPTPAWKIFLSQFTNILIIILLAAAAISAAIGEIKDFIAIMAIVILNGIFGFIQEYKAERAMQALKAALPHKARTVRDNEQQEIDAKLLVPGDLIIVESGDKIPADSYLLSASNLQIQEAALTGESLPVIKTSGVLPEKTPLAEQSNMIFSGTLVTNGTASGVVVSTGMQTQFGKIARLTQTTKKEKSPLQKRMEVLAKQLGIITLLVAFAIILIGYIQKREFLEMFMTGVALAVAVIPEGLPAVVTITLALGVQRMLKRNCLVRRLTANETIGSASIICTDKTGTLTKNEMTVTEIWLPENQLIKVTGSGYQPEGEFLKNQTEIVLSEDFTLKKLLETGMLCNHSELVLKNNQWDILGDPTEGALIVAGKKVGLDKRNLLQNLEPVSEFSFSSERKRMSVIYKQSTNGTYLVFTKGAPEIILSLCSDYYQDNKTVSLDKNITELIENKYQEMAASGLRVLALATKKVSSEDIKSETQAENNLTFLGLAGMLDPPRPEAESALKTAQQAGIKVSIVTGDNLLTTQAVVKKLGLKVTEAYQGQDLDKFSNNKIIDILKVPFSIFARTTPEHKLKITQLLQKDNQIVAMTGDGINDAPALKKADVGISMGIKGTDVAKYASDAVLLDDNFASIVQGNKEGRRQFDNIQKFTRYLLSCNFGEIIAIGGGIFLGLPLVMLPVQILWMNLITDGIGALTLGLEPAEPDIMKQPPRKPRDPILSKKILFILVLIGLYEGMATLGIFKYALDHFSLAEARTLAFTGLILMELVNVFNFRSFRFPLYKIGFFTNLLLWAALIFNVLLQIGVVYIPVLQNYIHTAGIPLSWWLILLAISLPLILAGELVKYIRSKP